jgi:hypothetical protein
VRIELDLTKSVDGLRIAKQELEMALNFVTATLDVLDKKPAAAATEPPVAAGWIPDWSKPIPIPKEAFQAPGATGATIIDALGETFTMRQARDAGAAAGVTDQRIRNEVARRIKWGHLVETEKGKGRKASTFKKIRKPNIPTREDVADQL